MVFDIKQEYEESKRMALEEKNQGTQPKDSAENDFRAEQMRAELALMEQRGMTWSHRGIIKPPQQSTS